MYILLYDIDSMNSFESDDGKYENRKTYFSDFLKIPNERMKTNCSKTRL